MDNYTIFAVNPGSTSTKVALFHGNVECWSETVVHDACELANFATITEQKPYRMMAIDDCLRRAQIALVDTDAFVGRGGGLFPMEGGTYRVTPLLLDHACRGANGVQHPAQLGPQIAAEYAEKYGKQAYVVNPPDVDELQDLARMTGISGVYRRVHLHALNLKEMAMRHAKYLGKDYTQCRLIVCHIGGGISISAHCNGRMIDGFDIAGGEGPMAPTRCGSLSIASQLQLQQHCTPAQIMEFCTKSGGFVSHLGISDAATVEAMAYGGDRKAEMVWNSMLYQIEKSIGAMAAVLKGKVDGILLGGGMAHSSGLVRQITENCKWIAPVTAYPGEFEMEAMAAGVCRVLSGKEIEKIYTGKPVWDGFDFS